LDLGAAHSGSENAGDVSYTLTIPSGLGRVLKVS
jgi:hypothetical protein